MWEVHLHIYNNLNNSSDIILVSADGLEAIVPPVQFEHAYFPLSFFIFEGLGQLL